MVLTLDDLVRDVMMLLRRKGLDCSRYAPYSMPRVECWLPDGRKLIVIAFITEARR